MKTIDMPFARFKPTQAALCLTLLGSSASCASVQLTPSGEQVRLMKADPPADCREIGGLSADPQGFGRDVDNSKKALRNEAAEQGANYVRLETLRYTELTGTAYDCP